MNIKLWAPDLAEGHGYPCALLWQKIGEIAACKYSMVENLEQDTIGHITECSVVCTIPEDMDCVCKSLYGEEQCQMRRFL